MATPQKLAEAIVARHTLTAHKRTLNKEIAARDRRLGKIIESIARRDLGQELPLEGQTDALSPESAALLEDPTRGL